MHYYAHPSNGPKSSFISVLFVDFYFSNYEKCYEASFAISFCHYNLKDSMIQQGINSGILLCSDVTQNSEIMTITPFM